MATQSREPAVEEAERGLLGQIEVHSIDWIPDTERHGKTWQQAMLWFLGNFQYFTIPIGFVGPALGLSLGWSILAGVLGIWFGTLFMAFHATQGPVFGLPQMIQTRAQLGYRGVVVALFAVLFTYMAFNVADQVLLASGLNGAFGWNADAGRHRHRDPGRGAGHLRLRLGAPGLPVPADHLVPVLRDHLGRHPGRARRRARAGTARPTSCSPRSCPSSRWPPPTTSPTRRTSRTTPATCRATPGRAASSPRCSSAPPARRSG